MWWGGVRYSLGGSVVWCGVVGLGVLWWEWSGVWNVAWYDIGSSLVWYRVWFRKRLL